MKKVRLAIITQNMSVKQHPLLLALPLLLPEAALAKSKMLKVVLL